MGYQKWLNGDSNRYHGHATSVEYLTSVVLRYQRYVSCGTPEWLSDARDMFDFRKVEVSERLPTVSEKYPGVVELRQ